MQVQFPSFLVDLPLLATIDSGAKAGCAIWYDFTLVWCGLIHLAKPEELAGWLRLQSQCVKTVVELPIVYSSSKTNTPAQDLVTLGFRAGRLAPHGEVKTIWPVTWKGNVPDQILYRRILVLLSQEEYALIPALAKSDLHNVLDGIGIGLHELGRVLGHA